ncbi:MAG: hypothetical protein KAW88_07010 [Candidatus Cloacimonetes bacterium]|nr:hypothetical protein [Candidatus Cloacimonadota bacterium]
MNKTGEERFLMGISMFQTARELVLASFPKDISDKQKKKLLLERFYGKENPFSLCPENFGTTPRQVQYATAHKFPFDKRERAKSRKKSASPFSLLRQLPDTPRQADTVSSSQKRGEKSCNNKQTVLTSEVAMKKLKQFAMLYEMAWELKRAAFQKKYPQLENAEINKLTAKVFTMAKT